MAVYDRPQIRYAGDAMVGIEFADEVDLEVSFHLLALDRLVRESGVDGVTETVPTTRTLGVVYDILSTSPHRLVQRVESLVKQAWEINELPSRVITVPVLYGDPWTREVAGAAGVPDNVEVVARANGLTPAEIIRRHTATTHWVTHLGFTPGCFAAYSLDATSRFTAPKYDQPRTSTPSRVLAVGGICTTIYPIASPGGYQMLGRTPIDFYDPGGSNPAFEGGVTLTRPGDRHRYVAISEEEYFRIRAQVEAGTYEYRIEDGVARWPETFSRS